MGTWCQRRARGRGDTTLQAGDRKAPAGEGLTINLKVTPAESGPVAVEIQRFDPFFGWQYFAEDHIELSGGSASVPFTPGTPGLWRAKATYEGSDTASPSAVGFSYLLAT
jgi:hypothetical protein